MEFFERLTIAMKTRNKKQTDLTRDLNISSGGISMLVNGKREPSEPMLRTLSSYLNVSYAWLKTGEGEMEPVLVQDDTPGKLMARYRSGSASTRMLLRVMAELDDDWYDKLDAVLKRLEAEVACDKEEESE